jgi:hypothetical protein
MTDTQLYLAIGVPILFNAAMLTLIVNLLNKHIDDRVDGLEKGVNARFDAVNQRFDDMRDLWRSELHRVEEILDARLKHLEEQRH